ncbi:hypothetical protein Xaut_2242 [Xanthobacter versatilis]|uniref:Uncharacterized protein n=1 Tax=Xanthobacter autotrophicus (strain ATCC BAA-1158 / Py2) TaxID=78245 RepID=A7IHJ2_XANP2|nr:hypothetical protein Xaut_2242 [Xanthobacter autotrophicus Py2]
MSRRNRRRRSTEIGKLVAAALLLLLCAIIVAGVAVWRWNAPAPVELTKDTLCPVGGPWAITVVLLDASDDIPPVTKAEIQTVLRDAARTIQKGELLELRALDPRTPGGRILFEKCNPGDGTDLSTLSANPDAAKRRWLSEFDRPLTETLAHLDASSSATSPLLATIQAIAVQRFGGAAARELRKRLIVVSDMIEHGPEYSQYKGDLSYGRFKKTATYKATHTNLNGASVDFYYIQRIKPILDSGAHIQFWLDWIADSSGTLGVAKKLQGGG